MVTVQLGYTEVGLLFYINSYSWLAVATLKSTERARKVDSILISGCDPHCSYDMPILMYIEHLNYRKCQCAII